MAENEAQGTAPVTESAPAQATAAPSTTATPSAEPASAAPASAEPKPAVTEQTLLAGAEEAAEATPAAPEAYQAFTNEQGEQIDLEGYKGFAAAAKESGLSQENAQKMFGAMRTEADNYVRQKTQELSAKWAEASKADAEFGGAKFSENCGQIAAAYKQFATPELKNLLDASGLGNHPEVMRLFYRVGKALAQDTGVKAQEAPATEHRMFPKSNMVI